MRKRFLILLFIFLILFLSFPLHSSAEASSVSSLEEMYERMGEDVEEWKTETVYRTSFEPKNLEIEKIRGKVEDYITSNCFYSFSWKYQKRGKGYEVEIEYSYYMTEGEYRKVKEECKRIAKQLEGKSDYEKIKYAHDYIVFVCDYSYINDGPYSCLFRGSTACNGYALAFQMIMDACNIPCCYITNTNHAWNRVLLDNFWYNVDVTWDDPGGTEPTYDWFLKCNSDFPDHSGADANALVSYELVEGLAKSEVFTFFLKMQITRYWPFIVGVIILGIAIIAYRWLSLRRSDGQLS